MASKQLRTARDGLKHFEWPKQHLHLQHRAMAAARLARSATSLQLASSHSTSASATSQRALSRHACAFVQPRRTFRTHRSQRQHQQPRYEPPSHRKESFASRVENASRNLKWAPIISGMLLGLAVHIQVRKWRKRDKQDVEEDGKGQPRERIKPSGPWQVQIMSTLPLKAVSRLWGRFNEIDLPVFLRIPGFKLYGWIFGVNFDEVAEPDLRVYPNLASFFYRELKPGVRPLDPNPDSLLSPADGRVVQFGTIEQGGEVEQVKGVTYSLDALLGSKKPTADEAATSNIALSSRSPQPSEDRSVDGEAEKIRSEEEFAQVNGISYTLPNLFSGAGRTSKSGWWPRRKPATDQSTKAQSSSETDVTAEFARDQAPWWSPFGTSTQSPTTLYYIVVYLAPGDYHRFHSPASWVVESRRHFAGELYSVSPYLVKNLPGLFTLNERIVLLGRWRWGFFSYIPVGATNVGSIKINFDRELRTNSLTTDTEADKAAEEARERGEPYSGFSEATYRGASALLKGHALKRGEEMGGFQLGSTIVMVFEAPKGTRPSLDEGYDRLNRRRGGWDWDVEKGQKVKMGQALGHVVPE